LLTHELFIIRTNTKNPSEHKAIINNSLYLLIFNLFYMNK